MASPKREADEEDESAKAQDAPIWAARAFPDNSFSDPEWLVLAQDTPALAAPVTQGRADLLARLAATKASRQSGVAAKPLDGTPSLTAARQERLATAVATVGRDEGRDATGASSIVKVGSSSTQKPSLSGRSRGVSSSADNYNNGKPDAKGARDLPDGSPKSKAPKGVPAPDRSRVWRGVIALFLFAAVGGFLWFLIHLRAKTLHQLKPPESVLKAASALDGGPSLSVISAYADPERVSSPTPSEQKADTRDSRLNEPSETSALTPADRRKARRAELAAAKAAAAAAAKTTTPSTPAASATTASSPAPDPAATSTPAAATSGIEELPFLAGPEEDGRDAAPLSASKTPAAPKPQPASNAPKQALEGEGRRRRGSPESTPSPALTLQMPTNSVPPSCGIAELRDSLRAAGASPAPPARRRLLSKKSKHGVDVVQGDVGMLAHPAWMDLVKASAPDTSGSNTGAKGAKSAPSPAKGAPAGAGSSAPGSGAVDAKKSTYTADQRKAAAAATAAAFRQRAFETLRQRAHEARASQSKDAGAVMGVVAQRSFVEAGAGGASSKQAASQEPVKSDPPAPAPAVVPTAAATPSATAAAAKPKTDPVTINTAELYGEEEEEEEASSIPVSKVSLFAPPLESSPVAVTMTNQPKAAEAPSMMERAAKKIAEMKERRAQLAAGKAATPAAASSVDKGPSKDGGGPQKVAPFKQGHGFKVSLDDEKTAGAVWRLLLGKPGQGPFGCQESGPACGPDGDRFGLKLSNKKAAMGACAVVAPGPVTTKATENKYGSLIDAHRTVVRIGQGPLEGAEDAVGRRTTVVVVRPWVRPGGRTLGDVWELSATAALPTATPSGGPPKIKRLPRPMQFYWAAGRILENGERDTAAPAIPPVGRHPSTRPYVTSSALSNTTAAADLYAVLDKFVVYKGPKGEPLEPSVGLQVVVTLLHSGLCERISLFGFTLDGVGHFFDDSLGYRTGGGLSQRHVAGLEKYVYSVAMANGLLCMYD
eukprot:jgi/Mesvir1/28959/Mv17736-RA.1